MSLSLPRFAALTILAPLALAAGCNDPYRRLPAPRDRQTIFTDLNLPTPNTFRLASGHPGPAYWQQRVDYDMDITLDAATDTLHGRLTMTYHNRSPQPLPYLWLQLEQNLFKTDSLGQLVFTGDRPLEAAARFRNRRGLTLHRVAVQDHDLTPAVYDTLARIDLPEPIKPIDGHVDVEIEWSFKIHKSGVYRMGAEDVTGGTIYELAQWFPAACVYDDVEGWNTLPYLGPGEFYTNFGNYDVRITAPRDHLVAATGTLQNPEEVLTEKQQRRLEEARAGDETIVIRGVDEVNDPRSRPAGEGPLTWRFVAYDVRTFAFASSSTFIWDACGLSRAGRCPVEEDGEVVLPERTLIQSFYPVDALPLWEEATQMLRQSTEHFSEKWYPYPYPTATNVNGPAGGMEYPMIIFCGTRGSGEAGEDGEPPLGERRSLYGLIAHEIGHNWFPMVVNTDERRHAWMDEGFDVFIDIYAMQSYFGGDGSVADRWPGLLETLEEEVFLPIVVPVDQMKRVELRSNAYRKTGMGMYTLREGVLGAERFDPAFREYIESWAFKSPQPADFFRCMEDGSGQDLDWFWRGWFFETSLLDQEVVAVRQYPDEGLARLTFRNNRELVMPVVYWVAYEDGSGERRRVPVEAWYTEDRIRVWIPTNGKRIEAVTVDPDFVFPDVNRANNSWRRGW